MRLDYKLLWVEDEADWVDTYKEILEDYLYSIGFKLEVHQIRKAPTAEEIFSFDLDKYHLIFMDYELGAGSTGRDVIQSIRQAGSITEVVFYSANPELYNEIRGSALEGVYWANRDDQFEDRVKDIINLTIRRVMDLPAMRGLAVTEVSDIDHLMEKIITTHHTLLDEKGKAHLRGKIYKKIKDSAEEFYKTACSDESRCGADIMSILNHGGMDSNKRWRTLKNFIASCTSDKECLEIFEKYLQILDQRNDLAHGYTKIIDGGAESVVGKKNTYTLSHAIQIRQDLLKHRDNFETIYSNLSADKT